MLKGEQQGCGRSSIAGSCARMGSTPYRGVERAGERTVKEQRSLEDRARERASGAYEELLPPERLSDEEIDAETVRNVCVAS